MSRWSGICVFIFSLILSLNISTSYAGSKKQETTQKNSSKADSKNTSKASKQQNNQNHNNNQKCNNNNQKSQKQSSKKSSSTNRCQAQNHSKYTCHYKCKHPKYILEITSYRDEYITGMEAAFNVKLTDRRGRPVNMRQKYLYATFPSTETVIDLTKVDRRNWSYSTVASIIGDNTLSVELRHDHRKQIACLEDLLERIESEISYYESKKIYYKDLYNSTRSWWKKLYYRSLVNVCETNIRVLNNLITAIEKQIEHFKRPIVSAEKIVTVYKAPEPVITGPVLNAFVRDKISVTVNLDWDKGGKLILVVDGEDKVSADFAATATASELTVRTLDAATVSATIELDTATLTDGEHIISVRVEPAGFPTTYVSDDVKIIVDNTIPEITNVFPEADSFTNEKKSAISVNLSDATSGIVEESIKLSLDSVLLEFNRYEEGIAFTPQEDLADGDHSVTVEVSDNAGNTASLTFKFTIDTVYPEITDLFPEHGTVMRLPKPFISASLSDDRSGIDQSSVTMKIDDSPVTVTVNDNVASYEPENNFTEGEHTIELSAKDIAGNESVTIWKIVNDYTPPTVVNVEPQTDSLTNNNTVELKARLIDLYCGINDTSVSMTVNGDTVTPTVSAEGKEAAVSYTPENGYPDGENTVEISFADIVGNTSSYLWSFNVDTTPPVVPSLYGAENPVITEEDEKIVQIATSTDTVSISVVSSATVASISQTGTGDGILIWTVNFTDLQEGDNQIAITATDAAGNVSTAMAFTVQQGIPDTEPPIILSIEPETGSEFENEYITLFGTAKNHAFAKVHIKVWRIGGNTGTTGNFVSSKTSEDIVEIDGPDENGLKTWSWSVSNVKLGRALNRVEVIAEDESGNTVTEEVMYYLKPFLPGNGADTVQPLKTKAVKYSFWPRDTQDIASHNLKTWVHVKIDDPYMGVWEYDGGTVNKPTNFVSADQRWVYMDAEMWGMPESITTNAYVTYSVTYNEPGGQTSTYNFSEEKQLPDDSNTEADLPCELVLQESGNNILIKVIPKAGHSNKEYDVEGHVYISGKFLRTEYSYTQGWYLTNGGVSKTLIFKPDCSITYPKCFQETDYTATTTINDASNIKHKLTATLHCGADYRYKGLPDFEMNGSPMKHDDELDIDYVDLTYSLDPNSSGGAYQITGAIPDVPFLAYPYYSCPSIYTTVMPLKNQYMKASFNPDPVTTSILVSGFYENATERITTRPRSPYWSWDEDKEQYVKEPAYSYYYITPGTKARKSREFTTHFVISTRARVKISPSSNAWIKFANYPQSGWPVRQGDSVGLALFRYVTEPVDAVSADLSFSPTGPSGATIPTKGFKDFGGGYSFNTSNIPTGPLTVTATVNEMKTVVDVPGTDPVQQRTLASYGPLTATQSFDVFTHEIEIYDKDGGEVEKISGEYVLVEGEEYTLRSVVDGTDFCNTEWYIDATEKNNTAYPHVVPDGSGDEITHKFKVPYYEDEWFPGSGWKPSSVVKRIICFVYHDEVPYYGTKLFSSTLEVKVNSRTTLDSDCVISDGESGPENKVVHYSLAKDMKEGYIAIRTKETASSPDVYRQVLEDIDLSAGVHSVTLDDELKKVIGEDCWAVVNTTVDGVPKTATDQMWTAQEQISLDNWKDLPHGSPQYIYLDFDDSNNLKFELNGKQPENDLMLEIVGESCGSKLRNSADIAGTGSDSLQITKDDSFIIKPGDEYEEFRIKVSSLAKMQSENETLENKIKYMNVYLYRGAFVGTELIDVTEGIQENTNWVENITQNFLGYNVTRVDDVTKDEALSFVRTKQVFYYFTHGVVQDSYTSAGAFKGFKVDDGYICPEDVSEVMSNRTTPYRLVFINGCMSASDAYVPDPGNPNVNQNKVEEMADAFKAKAYVGWRTTTTAVLAGNVSAEFFMNLDGRRNVQFSIDRVHKLIPKSSNFIIIKGEDEVIDLE